MERDIINNFIASKFAKILGEAVFSSFCLVVFQLFELRVIRKACFYFLEIIPQADKFLKCDWLRSVVFKPNLKY